LASYVNDVDVGISLTVISNLKLILSNKTYRWLRKMSE